MKTPTELIDLLFNRLYATYGAAWERSIGQAPINDVKSVWSDSLSGYLKTKESMLAIRWAIENLPDRVPNALEFRSLCRAAPVIDAPMLPMPKVNPEIAEKVLSGLKAATISKIDHKAWAKKIMLNYKGGLRQNPTSLQMARDALGNV